jgi:hypothetical protein
MQSNIKTFLRCALKVVFGMLFVGFVFPLWWAHNTSFSAVRQIAGDPEFLGHSMPYEELSMDLTTVGYAWLGCSMAWLFWRVTRRTKQDG